MCLWVLLGASGSLWELLGASGTLWELLGASGNLWERLGTSWSLWEPWRDLEGPTYFETNKNLGFFMVQDRPAAYAS